MFLIPIVGGLLAGLLMDDQRKAMITTAVLWVIGSGLLIAVTLMDDEGGLTAGTWGAVAFGLLGFALAWVGQQVRGRRAGG